MALNTYVDAKKTYPPGQSIFAKVTSARPSSRHPLRTATDPWAWSYLILPYMEQQVVYDIIQNASPGNPLSAPNNLSNYVSNSQGYNGSTIVISSYLCPSVAGMVDPSRNQATNQLQYVPAYTSGATYTKGNANTGVNTNAGQNNIGMACCDYAGIEGPDNYDIYGNPLFNGWIVNTANPRGVQYTKTPFAHGMMPKLPSSRPWALSPRKPFHHDGSPMAFPKR